MTYEEIKNNEEINSYIRQADASLVALGFTEHSFAPVSYTHLDVYKRQLQGTLGSEGNRALMRRAGFSEFRQ